MPSFLQEKKCRNKVLHDLPWGTQLPSPGTGYSNITSQSPGLSISSHWGCFIQKAVLSEASFPHKGPLLGAHEACFPPKGPLLGAHVPVSHRDLHRLPFLTESTSLRTLQAVWTSCPAEILPPESTKAKMEEITVQLLWIQLCPPMLKS